MNTRAKEQVERTLAEVELDAGNGPKEKGAIGTRESPVYSDGVVLCDAQDGTEDGSRTQGTDEVGQKKEDQGRDPDEGKLELPSWCFEVGAGGDGQRIRQCNLQAYLY